MKIFISFICMTIFMVFPITSGHCDLIACASPVNGCYQIMVIDTETGTVEQLTSSRTEKRHPAWSPDGSRICYESNGKLFLVPYHGTNTSSEISGLGCKAGDPRWISSTQLSFTCYTEMQNDHTSIWTIDLATGQRVKLMDRPFMDRQCDWANEMMAWTAGGETFGYEIFVQRSPDEGPFQLTDNQTNDFDPKWSHDGKYIAYQHYQKTDSIIVVRQFLTENQFKFGFPDCYNGNPAWSSDAQSIYWISNNSGDFQLYRTKKESFQPELVSKKISRVIEPDVKGLNK